MSTREIAMKLHRIASGKAGASDTVSSAATAVYCALLANIVLAGEFAPLGVVSAAFGGKRMIFALLGAILGYVASFTPGSAIYCAALLVAAGFKGILMKKSRRLAEKAVPFVNGGAVLVCSLPKMFSEGIDAYAAAALVCQALTVGAVSAVVSRMDAAVSSRSGPALTENETAALCAAAAMGLCGLTAIWPAAFNPFDSLAVACVLWAGVQGGAMAGMAAGSTFGGLFALMTGSPFYMLPLSVGGMAAGLMRRTGKAAAVTGMLVLCALSLAVCGADDITLIYTLELLTGCAVLLLIPDGVLRRAGNAVFSRNTETSCDKRAAAGLYNAGKGLSEAAECITAVSDRLKKVNSENAAWVYEAASGSVCARCGLKNTCWTENYSDTMNSLSVLTPALTRFGRISRDDLPAEFAADCPKSAEMAAAINRFYGEFALKRATDDYAFQMRGMLAKQFKGLADIVMELSADLGENGGYDRMAGRRAYDVFSGEFLRADECVCLLDSRKRMTLEVTGDEEIAGVDMDKLMERIEEALGRRFRKPQIIPLTGGNVKLIFRERTEYRLDTAASGIPANGEKISGDQRCVFNHNGSGICIISDGMGSGSLASVESKMTVTLMHRLICAGFSYESALSVVNWSLMVKGSDERLATADLLSVDMYTGAAKIMKAGAPSTFVKHGNDVKEMSFPSVPVGILSDTGADSRTFRLSPGDVVVMVSDGALYGDNGWIMREISAANDDIAALADSLAARAKARRPSNEDDDITVLCARLAKAD